MTSRDEQDRRDDEYADECERLDKAVDSFAKIMKAKLHLKAAQGYEGWGDPHYLTTVRTKMLEKAARLYAGDVRQAEDVANLAMMCFIQSARTVPKRPGTVLQRPEDGAPRDGRAGVRPPCGAQPNTVTTETDHEPRVIGAAVRDALEELHIECRFEDGQKFAAIRVDSAHPALATMIANFLSANTP